MTGEGSPAVARQSHFVVDASDGAANAPSFTSRLRPPRSLTGDGTITPVRGTAVSRRPSSAVAADHSGAAALHSRALLFVRANGYHVSAKNKYAA